MANIQGIAIQYTKEYSGLKFIKNLYFLPRSKKSVFIIKKKVVPITYISKKAFNKIH